MEKLQPALREYLLTSYARMPSSRSIPATSTTGASPNETQSVETTTTDAKAKTLKKKKKIPLIH